jgi:hypothetical protein
MDDPGGIVSDQRGLSVVELLIAAAAGTVILASLLSFSLATARSVAQSSAQAALQRQGSLALEQIGLTVRSAVPNGISLVTCNGVANSVQVVMPDPRGGAWPDVTACYYARDDGALCEFRDGRCRNLLTGGLDRVVLVRQGALPDPRFPTVPPGAPCFTMSPNLANPQSQVDVAFAIRDDDGDFDGVNAMSFAISLTCSGRNC